MDGPADRLRRASVMHLPEWPVRFPGPTNSEQSLYVLNVATSEENWKSKVPTT